MPGDGNNTSSSGGISSSSATVVTTSTYEATKARESTRGLPDPIHWERGASYRNQAYRHLHHQEGLIGKFQIRLLEAADLKRSYWSALALGPVKLLGLSKAHGAVSSFCTFSLQYDNPYLCDDFDEGGSSRGRKSPMAPTALMVSGGADSKPSAKPSPSNVPMLGSVVSPVIPQDNSPVWTNCAFDFPLTKEPGTSADGQRIVLAVRVDEDGTAVENMLPVPGVPSGEDARLLGTGTLDITSLCLGQNVVTGQPQSSVLDAWIPIRLSDKDVDEDDVVAAAAASSKLSLDDHELYNPKKKKSSNKGCDEDTAENITGRVRVLVSYIPNGMEPQENDIVALEAFARNGSNISGQKFATCAPVLPPLLPMTVLECSGPWLLVEYQLQPRSRQLYAGYRGLASSDAGGNSRKACLRLHRNCVFVIERKNIVDETINLALLPADIFMRTPLGQGSAEVLGPLFIASRQLLMPALLSAKLMWMAVRTTTLASVTGVQAATSAMWTEGSSSLLTDGENDGSNRRRRYHRDEEVSKYKYISL